MCYFDIVPLLLYSLLLYAFIVIFVYVLHLLLDMWKVPGDLGFTVSDGVVLPFVFCADEI